MHASSPVGLHWARIAEAWCPPETPEQEQGNGIVAFCVQEFEHSLMRLDPLDGTLGFIHGRMILLEKYFVPSVSRHGCSKWLQVLLENIDVDIGVDLRLWLEPVDRSCALGGETNPRHLSAVMGPASAARIARCCAQATCKRCTLPV